MRKSAETNNAENKMSTMKAYAMNQTVNREMHP